MHNFSARGFCPKCSFYLRTIDGCGILSNASFYTQIEMHPRELADCNGDVTSPL